MTNKINQRTVNLVKEFEGYEDRLPNGSCMSYLDQNATPANPNYDHASGGLWTIGYGATGPGITKGTIWTQDQADSDLAVRLDEKGKEVLAKLTVSVNDNQYGALSSIAYNVGTYGIRGLLAKVNQDPGNAGPYFAAYKYGTVGGQHAVMAGLVRRRTAERELYEWETASEVVAITPPLQDANKVQTATGVGAFSIAGLWQYLPQVKEFMADHNGIILLGVVGAVFGVTELYKWRQHQAFDNGTLVPVGAKPVPTIEDTEAFNETIPGGPDASVTV